MFLRFRAWFNGKRNGKKGIPITNNNALAPFELRICAIANQNINDVHCRWAGIDAQMSANHRTTGEKYQQSANNYTYKRNELKRDTTVEKLWHYYLTVITIGLCEMVANVVAFRILGDNNILTLIMAISILIGIPLGGHALGKSLKQGMQNVWGRILLGIAVLIIITSLIGFAIIRKDYISLYGLKVINQKVAIFTFISLNLMLFLVCAVIAYMSYDADPLIYKYKKDYMKYQNLFHNAVAKREAWSRAQESRARTIRELAIEVIQIYRTTNLRIRFKKGETQIPESFKDTPDIPIPSFNWRELQTDHRNKLYKFGAIPAITKTIGANVSNDDQQAY